MESGRALPTGFWKGSGLALLLDALAAILSEGLTTAQLGRLEAEHNVSQVFIAFDAAKAMSGHALHGLIDGILQDFHATGDVLHPGQRALRVREHNLRHGVLVDTAVWEEVVRLAEGNTGSERPDARH